MLILITPGDPEGVGPEIVFKSLLRRQPELPPSTQILCIGAIEPFQRMGASLIEVGEFNSPSELPRTRPGEILFMAAPKAFPRSKGKAHSKFSLPGYQSGWSIERATKMILTGKAAAMVTGPICKSRLHAGGYRYPGHTEMLAKLCKSKEVTMMLANDQLRVSLVTSHLALGGVSRALNAKSIKRTVRHTVEALQQWWGIESPKVAVAALNPHAGEGGMFGKEEIRTISPAISALKREFGDRVSLQGPLPADTLFAKNASQQKENRYDAIVCMYHDQGLIPVKLLDFARTVNITLGLPIIRTSVDHGVAFDLVGTGRADPSSFQSALRLAHELASKRKEID